jgi:hypothetical protein
MNSTDMLVIGFRVSFAAIFYVLVMREIGEEE